MTRFPLKCRLKDYYFEIFLGYISNRCRRRFGLYIFLSDRVLNVYPHQTTQVFKFQGSVLFVVTEAVKGPYLSLSDFKLIPFVPVFT
jgi:hypothetical protein